ncbi:Asp23/Gls24 family envelope stress response protein [Curtobacterium sp. RRHDQ66]|uniref:Asp23/Gls24 family envelope stress response protein n=1 Tax=Curtobacterium guangdongense TaxID=3413380 RepID=UPI003BF40F8D
MENETHARTHVTDVALPASLTEPLPADASVLTVAARTAAVTAIGVDGVHHLGGVLERAADQVRSRLGRTANALGVQVDDVDGTLDVQVSLVVTYPERVTTVAEEVRAQVAHAVTQVAGRPATVDVRVTDVHGPFDDEPSKVSEAVDTVREKAAEATERVKDTATDAAETVKGAASDAATKAQEVGADVADRTRDAADRTREAAAEALDQVRDTASETADRARDAAAEVRDSAADTVDRAGVAGSGAVDDAVDATKRAADDMADAAAHAAEATEAAASEPDTRA